MAIARKIPATVVTGFLGAGKTTMIRNLIEKANGKKLALVINEFGDLAVDGDLLKGCGNPDCTDDDIFELANGCICCTVADDFLPTIQKILDRPDLPDHIVIETSGLALPKPLVQAFGWPEVRTRITVDGVVAVLDGPAVADGRFADDPDRVDAQRAEDERRLGASAQEEEKASLNRRRSPQVGVDNPSGKCTKSRGVLRNSGAWEVSSLRAGTACRGRSFLRVRRTRRCRFSAR